MSNVSNQYGLQDVRAAAYIDALWQEFRAAVVVRWRVDTPEVRAEVQRAKVALLTAIGVADSS